MANDVYLGFKSEQTDSFLIRGVEYSSDLMRIEIYNINKCKSKYISCTKEEMNKNFNILSYGTRG